MLRFHHATTGKGPAPTQLAGSPPPIQPAVCASNYLFIPPFSNRIVSTIFCFSHGMLRAQQTCPCRQTNLIDLCLHSEKKQSQKAMFAYRPDPGTILWKKSARKRDSSSNNNDSARSGSCGRMVGRQPAQRRLSQRGQPPPSLSSSMLYGRNGIRFSCRSTFLLFFGADLKS